MDEQADTWFLQRFWARARKRKNGCWVISGSEKWRPMLWTGRKNLIAARFAWEVTRTEEVPAGMLVCHACDNPRCVRPSHLFIGTASDNSRDMVRKGRWGTGFRTQAAFEKWRGGAAQ